MEKFSLELLLPWLGALYQPMKDLIQSISSRNQEVSTTLLAPPIEQETESYPKAVGTRLKYLREILGLSPKEISTILGIKEASVWEAYEEGTDELPNKFIEKLVQVFFINPEFIQEGKEPIFRTFDNFRKLDDCCRYYLEQDFQPCFLCSPNFDKSYYAYLIFWKKDQKYQRIVGSKDKGCKRMIAAEYESGFDSLTGDGHGISKFISAMLDLNLSPNLLYISFFNVDLDEWEKLENRCWYNKNMDGHVGSVNYKAQDIFESLFKEAQEARERS